VKLDANGLNIGKRKVFNIGCKMILELYPEERQAQAFENIRKGLNLPEAR
jgi:hypothetical protein